MVRCCVASISIRNAQVPWPEGMDSHKRLDAQVWILSLTNCEVALSLTRPHLHLRKHRSILDHVVPRTSLPQRSDAAGRDRADAQLRVWGKLGLQTLRLQ
eukprot:179316-Chlamydomonas_euryale.AAC.1